MFNACINGVTQMTITYPETPAGKRTVKHNIWGNIVGYVSGKRFWEFGTRDRCNEAVANAWQAGATIEDAQMAVLDLN